MSEAYVSLREVGRQLGVPPSTIVYYKDKFSRYIPSAEGQGRQRRYPAEVVEVFRRIREMFSQNYTVDQIQRELALKFGSMMNSEGYEQSTRPGAASSLSGDGAQFRVLLERMSDALDNQVLYQAELKSLRDEVARLRNSRSDLLSRYGDRVENLERKVSDLVAANRELEERFRRERAGGAINFPPREYLDRALVIRSGKEFLGVLGRGRKHFSLNDFVVLLERRMSESMDVETAWERTAGHWVLKINSKGKGHGGHQNIVLVTRNTYTPSKNSVTEIVRLNVNGKDAPQSLLLGLFRQIRTVFGG